MFRIILLLSCLFSFTTSALPTAVNETKRKFDQEQIKELKQDKRYAYHRKIEPPSSKYLLFLQKIFSHLLAFFSSTLGIAVLLLLLITLLYLAFKGNFLKKKNKIEIKEQLVPNEIDRSFDQLSIALEEAVQSNNFRLAIRYQFLITLKKLDALELIHWHIEKTNQQYYLEIPQALKADFSLLSKIFDFTWYGDHPADKVLFLYVQQLSTNLNRQKDAS